MRKSTFLIGIVVLVINVYAQYPNNEDGQFEDMLTPEYYDTPYEGEFRLELNKFVHFSRKIPFQHPLEGSSGQIPTNTINRSFGDGIGPGGTGSHHPAFDYFVGNLTKVNMYAAHDGIVSVNKDVARYRHYLTITTEVYDSIDNSIGKMVTIYAHIDLDLDSVDNLEMNGQYVNKGDLVSKNLYSGTMGGPHLHFEIRFYRNNDSGLEDFYGGNVGANTSPSSGTWTYGYWNPNVGYGFAHPLNQINTEPSNALENEISNQIVMYPNPAQDIITIKLKEKNKDARIELLSLHDQVLEKHKIDLKSNVIIDLSNYPPGIYLVRIFDGVKHYSEKLIKK